jgi:hypothetical protein
MPRYNMKKPLSAIALKGSFKSFSRGVLREAIGEALWFLKNKSLSKKIKFCL